MKKIFTFFAALLLAGSTWAYCPISSSDPAFPFKASELNTERFESEGTVQLSLYTNPSMIDGAVAPEEGDAYIVIVFTPKSLTDMRGIYSTEDQTITELRGGVVVMGTIMPVEGDGVTGNISIRVSDDETSYDIDFSFTMLGQITAGTVFGVCADEIDIEPICRVGSQADFGFKAGLVRDIEIQDKPCIIISIATNINWMTGLQLGDGEGLGLIIIPENREDLRGTYQRGENGGLYDATLFMQEDGELHQLSLKGEDNTVTITLNENGDSYDLSYHFLFEEQNAPAANEHETEGTIFGICDEKMAEGLAVETVSADNAAARKILRNGQLLIRRNDRTYTIHGAQL